jgi:hypothetical protein
VAKDRNPPKNDKKPKPDPKPVQGVSEAWTLEELGPAPDGMQWVLQSHGGAALVPLPQALSDGDTEPETGEIPPKPVVPGKDFYWNGQVWVPFDVEGYESESDKREREAKEQRDRQTAESYLTDLLSQYGLEELIPTVSGLIKEWGTNTNIIVSRLRGTEAYKTRFRGNADRIKNGYNALSEAEYLSSEDAIKSTMRKYGLTGDYYSRDKLATLIGGDVSATEVDGRIGQAKKVIDNADPNIKNSLVGLYGVGMSDMLGYVLAPETALEVVQRRVNAGFATGVARGQGIDLGSMGDTSLAEQIGDLTFGDERTLRSQFDAIGGLARSTRRLSGIDQERVSDRDVVKGEFGIDAQAGQRVKKMQSRERARFSGQSSTTSGTLSGGGI